MVMGQKPGKSIYFINKLGNSIFTRVISRYQLFKIFAESVSI